MPKSVKLPPVVLIAGDVHQGGYFWEARHSETAAGHIVITTGCACDERRCPPDKPDSSSALDTSKLLLADELLIINPGGEVSANAGALIMLAKQLQKLLRYSQPELAGTVRQATIDDYLASPPYRAESSDHPARTSGNGAGGAVEADSDRIEAQLNRSAEDRSIDDPPIIEQDGLKLTKRANSRTYDVAIAATSYRLGTVIYDHDTHPYGWRPRDAEWARYSGLRDTPLEAAQDTQRWAIDRPRRNQVHDAAPPATRTDTIIAGGDGLRATFSVNGTDWPITIETEDLRLSKMPSTAGYTVMRDGSRLGTVVFDQDTRRWTNTAAKARRHPGYDQPLDAARDLATRKDALREVTASWAPTPTSSGPTPPGIPLAAAPGSAPAASTATPSASPAGSQDRASRTPA